MASLPQLPINSRYTVRNATLDRPVSTASLSSTVRGLIRLLLSVAFVFWFFYVVSSGRPNLTSAVYQETVSLQTFFYALFTAYGIYLVAARKLPDWTPLGWSALALVAAYGLATSASPSWRLSGENSLLVAVCLVAFYVFNERRQFSISLLARSLLVVAAFVSIRAMLQLYDMYGEWFSAVEAVKGVEFGQLLPPPALRLQTVLNHPNNLAMFLNIALPFAMVTALQPIAG